MHNIAQNFLLDFKVLIILEIMTAYKENNSVFWGNFFMQTFLLIAFKHYASLNFNPQSFMKSKKVIIFS